jgi:EpsD family peptidyl-prolyl cis-trans isomerase
MLFTDRSSATFAARRAAAALLGLLLLSACGKDKAGDATQIAARVNKDEISIHQVQYALQRQPRLAAAQPQTAPRRVLEGLIEQELAAQAARSDGLDTDPSTVQAIEAAKREVLARVYQDRLASKAVSASADEVDRYYDSRPALFSERRLYTLQEFALDASDEDRARIHDAVKKAKNAEAIGEALRKAGLRFKTRQIAQAAEDLPMAVLESIAKLQDGESVLMQQTGSARIYTVLHAEPAPVDRQLSKAAIEAYLLSDRKRELVVQGMKSLREKAQITFSGSFASPASGAASAGASTAAPATAPASAAK